MTQNYSLLLVEPDTKQQALITRILQTEFNITDITVLTSSMAAISLLGKKNDMQCIIVSSSLDDGNGFSLTSDIRSINSYTKTPILIVSDKRDRNHLLQAAASGASDFIVKPFKDKTLSLKLKKLLADKYFRQNTRVSTLEAFDAELAFDSNTIYSCKLLDISAGGCSIKSQPFNQGGAVYDHAFINIQTEDTSIAIPAELVRIERDPESENAGIRYQIAGLEFKSEDVSTNEAISHFINTFDEFSAQNSNFS